jgi:hypothetical protein
VGSRAALFFMPFTEDDETKTDNIHRSESTCVVKPCRQRHSVKPSVCIHEKERGCPLSIYPPAKDKLHSMAEVPTARHHTPSPDIKIPSKLGLQELKP